MRPDRWTTTGATPVGLLRVVARDGAVVAVDFLDDTPPTSPSEARVRTRVDGRVARRPLGQREDDDPLLREAVDQLDRYFAGSLEEFDLPLAPEGTPFQLRVWEQLRSIRYGETASYGEVARRLGLTGHGARAVGLANGRNPIPVIVPCHRVVGASGLLVGYGGGLDRKRALLDLETERLF
jgi:methylated-DNA-[protein]-cysteine S-methyltransferase